MRCVISSYLETKKQLRQQLLELLKKRIVIIELSAHSASQGATHPDAKPENKYDTRGLESSYLAGAQQARLKELLAAYSFIENMPVEDKSVAQTIEINCLVELQMDDDTKLYWILAFGGGYSLCHGSDKIFTLSAHSPLARRLLGRCRNDFFDFRLPEKVYEVEIVNYY